MGRPNLFCDNETLIWVVRVTITQKKSIFLNYIMKEEKYIQLVYLKISITRGFLYLLPKICLNNK